MQYWLFKEEPGCYSFEQLTKDKRTTWDGIKNNLALKYLRTVKKGDRALFYHTGKIKAVVGEMVVVSEPRAEEDNEKLVVVDVEVVQPLSPVSLAALKAEPVMQESPLVKISRLSVVPLTKGQWQRILAMSQEEES